MNKAQPLLISLSHRCTVCRFVPLSNFVIIIIIMCCDCVIVKKKNNKKLKEKATLIFFFSPSFTFLPSSADVWCHRRRRRWKTTVFPSESSFIAQSGRRSISYASGSPVNNTPSRLSSLLRGSSCCPCGKTPPRRSDMMRPDRPAPLSRPTLDSCDYC